MNDKVNNTEKEKRRNNTPCNTLELKSVAKDSDRVFVYAPKDDDGIGDSGNL